MSSLIVFILSFCLSATFDIHTPTTIIRRCFSFANKHTYHGMRFQSLSVATGYPHTFSCITLRWADVCFSCVHIHIFELSLSQHLYFDLNVLLCRVQNKSHALQWIACDCHYREDNRPCTNSSFYIYSLNLCVCLSLDARECTKPSNWNFQALENVLL